MKVQIYIEGEQLQLYEDEQITVRSSVQDVSDISKLFADFSQSFNVPASDTNNGIFSHWYNADIDNGYDARTRVEATIDVGTLDFKRGKMRLDKVNLKNGRPDSYRITFFGDAIKVKDLIGDDKLHELSWLDGFDHTYSAANVLIGLTTGLDFTVDSILREEAVIYPLISYQRQYLYNFDSSDTTSTETLVNISYNAVRTDGVLFSELKPAIKLSLIVEAIEQKYGFTFTGSFLTSSEYLNIYMNLNKDTESLANGLKVYENYTGSYADAGIQARYTTTVTPQTSDLNQDYKIRLTYKDDTPGYLNETVVYESTQWLQGVQIKGWTSDVIGIQAGDAYTVTSSVITKEAFVFDATTRLEKFTGFSWLTDTGDGYPKSYSSQTIVLQTVITNEMPDIGVFDFLTSLFKMFNLVIVLDGEDISINDLQTWYTEGAIHDITQYVDTQTETVNRGKIFNQINFKFEESDQILADEFKQSNKQVYGNLEFKLLDSTGAEVNDVDGETLDVEVLFENPIFERLFDLNDNSETSIQYCLYTNRDIKAISGNPFLFYAPSVTVASNTVGFLGTTYEELSANIYMPSHSIQIDNESFVLNFNAEINEYTSSLFRETIYKNYYEDYITDIFSIKRRMYNYEAILPNSLLNTLKLNDRLVIRDTRFIINSIASDLVIRKDTLELINDIYDAPLASDLLSSSLFSPASATYNSEARSSTARYVGTSGNSIAAVDTGDGTAFLTIVESTTTTNVFTINFSITLNETGGDRTVQIQVTDGVNDPKFTIIQNTLFTPSYDYSDFRNSQNLH